jgi:uncharacterized Fe-S cluster-containing radical SAM superfamily enzyme
MRFDKWLDTFVSEKGLDVETMLEAEGASGMNYIPLACLIDALKAAPKHEQARIKSALVVLDFTNAPVLPLFNHLARAIAL